MDRVAWEGRPKNVAVHQVALRKRRKSFVPRDQAIAGARGLMDQMQRELFERALALRTARTRVINTLEEYERFFKQEGGGFALVHWAGNPADEEEMGRRTRPACAMCRCRANCRPA